MGQRRLSKLGQLRLELIWLGQLRREQGRLGKASNGGLKLSVLRDKQKLNISGQVLGEVRLGSLGQIRLVQAHWLNKVSLGEVRQEEGRGDQLRQGMEGLAFPQTDKRKKR